MNQHLTEKKKKKTQTHSIKIHTEVGSKQLSKRHKTISLNTEHQRKPGTNGK